ncbi:PstS family phosphate ABC transporter substrate-binding protein [Halobacterium bonnevillei]|uniref:Phosphate ABC transporter substrate-binding protein PstS family protein n=1 Tax=Halobacterium bonnevillei TaxID=2692200 RepID=A0A6B0SME6_9EURY|nr:PstS family phosphate ABC transporter substrate-binding protein [Halobacterium bonnevillei]MXR20693.1 phosphate ABC transporter substrate-binding protein PstS family protein [Halobacterium bonnevillei]
MEGNEPGPDGCSRRRFLAGAGAVGAAALAGCSRNPNLEDDETASLSGTIDIAGSSTVFPLATAFSEMFGRENGGVNFNLQSTGSGGGFANHFCPGSTDFNNASRPIREAEQAQCASNDVEPVELTVATDALTVIVNQNADWIEKITVEELATIWSEEEQPETWAAVNDDWPDEPVELYGPSDASGTYDYFIEAILHGDDRELSHRRDYSGTEQDRTILQGVEGSEFAMGYLGFAYYSTNQDTVRGLPIDNGDGPVEPSLENARSGEYEPLTRPLFTYPKLSALAEDHVAEFARFWMENTTNEGVIADEVGYVPLDEETKQAQMDTLEQAITEARE